MDAHPGAGHTACRLHGVVGEGLLGSWVGVGWIAILVATFAPSLVYTYARYVLGEKWSGLRTIPSMLVLGCGMCVNNSRAVVRGLFLRGGEFVRTAKSGSVRGEERRSVYRTASDKLWIVELSLGVYALFTFIEYYARVHGILSVFVLIYAAGFPGNRIDIRAAVSAEFRSCLNRAQSPTHTRRGGGWVVTEISKHHHRAT